VIDKVKIDENLFKTGDILIGRRFVGSSAQMMLLSGGLASHAAIVVREESGAAWVYDAQDNTHFKD